MRYISTRDNHEAVSPARAITTGMVPGGGLFVPEGMPLLADPCRPDETYQKTASRVLAPYLSDFSPAELDDAVHGAYCAAAFDTAGIVELVSLGERRGVLELWHGPTAAFKDMALQIMPFLMNGAKMKTGDSTHTVILVATSGDTGKAALEGFKDRPGISIIVFYPADGVSEIQKLQMVTTEGANTHVVAVHGNFDDCQNGVKSLFGDEQLQGELAACGLALSSANSINWGRLCPQIAYYVRAYGLAVTQGHVRPGDPVNFCVPTGNFGNILAGYYAKLMGLPIGRLICASNRNRVLADFFATGTYDRNRQFHQTMSPSMDILISSNLERFLYEATGRNAGRIREWYSSLARTGRYTVDEQTRRAMDQVITAGWADEEAVTEAIGTEFRRSGYVLDTHTAVAVAVDDSIPDDGVYTIIDSTASPYKFSSDVLAGLTGERVADEFAAIERLHALGKTPVHPALAGLRERPIRHSRHTQVKGMHDVVMEICRDIG